MKRIVLLVVVLSLAASASAQDSKSVSKTVAGQIKKIDAKNKTFTIKGPREELAPDTPKPTGRGSRGVGVSKGGVSARGGVGGSGRGGGGGGRGGGGGGAASGGGGGDLRRLEDIETKIVLSNQTEYEAGDDKLKFSDMRVGDYVTVVATVKGKKVEATKVMRTSSSSGPGK